MSKKLKLLAILIFFACLSQNCAYAYPDDENDSLNRIVVYGDTRTNDDVHRQIVDSIVNLGPDAVFHTGDLVDDGNDPSQWPVFNGIISDLLSIAEFYPALGNHEGNSAHYFDNFVLPNNERWYSVDIDRIHFIVLDSNADISQASDQYKWLSDDLAGVESNARFIVAVSHHPVFATGYHQEDEKNFKSEIVPLFEKMSVDIVFSGHNHSYERSIYNGIVYIVTGGGGAPLYDQSRTSPNSLLYLKEYHFCLLVVEGNHLTVDVLDRNTASLDYFILTSQR